MSAAGSGQHSRTDSLANDADVAAEYVATEFEPEHGVQPGSLAALALWLIVSLAFKWYVLHFGNYQKTYGAIGDVMAALPWFTSQGWRFCSSAQLNATIDRASQRIEPAALKVA